MKIARYFVVGGISAMIDLSFFAFFIKVAGWHYLLAAPVGFVIATFINYQLSIRHVFESGIRFAKHQEIGLVFIVSTIGLVINQAALYLLVENLHSDVILSKIVATGCVFFWNYGARHFYIFSSEA